MVAILFSRGCMGFAVGLTMPSAQIYVSEVVESSIRGTLGSFPALFMALGMLVTYVVGAYLPWHYLSYFCAAFPVLFFISVSVLPESPTWLINNGNEEDALLGLQWLRNGKNVE